MMSSEQLCRKKKKETSPSPWCGLSCLPDEMVLNCLARVSRSDLAALSLVSKRYHSLVVSPEFYETRSRMGYKEECVYVYLDTPYEPNPRSWFILRRGKDSSFSKNRLVPIPSFPTPQGAAFVALNGGIYVIGGAVDGENTSRVSFLDCRTHTWSYVPSMRVARYFANAGVLDGKIYVCGGYGEEHDEDPSKWVEVFDPKMQTWSSLLIPDPVISKEIHRVYDQDCLSYYFRTKEGMWNDFNPCKIDRLLYWFSGNGDVMWCKPWSGVRQGRLDWKKVYGLEDLQLSLRSKKITFVGEMADVWHCYMLNHGYLYGFQGLVPGFKPSNSGDNIVIFWDRLVGDDDIKRLEIWCAEISMERREDGEIWGTAKWSDAVFSHDPHPHLCENQDLQLLDEL